MNARERNINVGDRVLLRNETPRKSSTMYNPVPYTVTNKKGPMISVQNDAGHCVTRNSSVMKTVYPDLVGNMPKKLGENEHGENDIEDYQGKERADRQNMTYAARPVRDSRPPTYLKDFVS